MNFYYSITELKPVKKIYENVENIKKTYELLKYATENEPQTNTKT